MTKDKRFINNIPFSQMVTKEEFEKEYALNSFYFDEKGILSKEIGECPYCSNCGRGFMELEFPDPKTEKGKAALNHAVERMNLHLKEHLDKETKIEIERIKDEMYSKLRKMEIKRPSEEASSSAS